ncbi:unnamed protein product [Symbiodinium sp. CCMP2592]|nr:unnamed protein product [Symbiodinium sp. CCMP2592]
MLRFLVCQTSLSVSASEVLGQIAFQEHFPIDGVAQAELASTLVDLGYGLNVGNACQQVYGLGACTAMMTIIGLTAWYQDSELCLCLSGPAYDLARISEQPASEANQALLADIELEVMELRASLELKGIHRDAIQEACKKKRKEMLEEHDAKCGDAKKAARDGDPKVQEREKEREKEKDLQLQREKEKEKEREKKKKQEEKEAKEKEERLKKEKEKQAQEKERQRREKEKEREKEKDKEREKEKERERSKGKEKAKAKDSDKDAKQKDKDNDKGKDKDKDKAKQVKRRSPASKSPSGAAKKKVRR